jgi:hypothetical protein
MSIDKGAIMRTLTSFKQRRRLVAVLITLTLIAINLIATSTSAGPIPTEATVVLDTANAIPLPGTFRLVHGERGNETNPHVDCDVASYTYDDFQVVRQFITKTSRRASTMLFRGMTLICFRMFLVPASPTRK